MFVVMLRFLAPSAKQGVKNFPTSQTQDFKITVIAAVSLNIITCRTKKIFYLYKSRLHNLAYYSEYIQQKN